MVGLKEVQRESALLASLSSAEQIICDSDRPEQHARHCDGRVLLVDYNQPEAILVLRRTLQARVQASDETAVQTGAA